MGGPQSFKHDLKRHTPYRAGQTGSSEPPEEWPSAGQLACEVTCAQGKLHAGQPASLNPPAAACLVYYSVM
eukprot:5645422-Pyramimonas_sp.AAC.1